MKTCSKCKIEKSTANFSKDRSRKSGLTRWCKSCVKARQQSPAGKASTKRSKVKYYDTIKGHLAYVYTGMKQRCNNPKCPRYKDYGGRGVRCLFQSLNDFRDYVINVLKVDPRGLQIDRINNNGNYEPCNIRFCTAKVNCNNRSNSRKGRTIWVMKKN